MNKDTDLRAHEQSIEVGLSVSLPSTLSDPGRFFEFKDRFV